MNRLDLGLGPQAVQQYRLPAAYTRTGSTLALPSGVEQTGLTDLESGIVGFRLPWLPDFLDDSRLAGPDRHAALGRFLAGWHQHVSSLWSAQNASFSLRFRSDPQKGSIFVYLLIRVTSRPGTLARDMNPILHLIKPILSANHIEPVTLSESELGSVLNDLQGNGIIELCQAEYLFPIRLPHEIVDAYAILPFARPTGDLIDLLHALKSQPEPVALNIHLQPTRLSPAEATAISRAATWAKNVIELNHQGRTRSISLKNPQAETLFRIYSGLEKRLVEPFLTVAQVVSHNVQTAAFIADRLGTAITSRDAGNIEEQVEEIPSGFATHAVDRAAWQAAQTVWRDMWFAPSSFGQATEGKERLRYLTDARGAATLYRLPVPSVTGLPGIEVRKIKQSYERARTPPEQIAGSIVLGADKDGAPFAVSVEDLARHTLICGIPGSGKTNTSLNILVQLWRDHRIPFWVFEPPKTEYRGLLKQPGFEEALVFTVGDESVAPLRFNPFELLPDISVEEHAANLRVCFEAAMPQLDDSGALVGMFMDRAIRQSYKRKGWRSSETGDVGRPLPTLPELLDIVSDNLSSYTGEVKQNLEASMQNRLLGLLRGSKGRMFNIERGTPLSELMHRPVIFELQPMGPDAPLALMFLLTFLQEYASHRLVRKANGIEHVTLVEEAHVVMSAGDKMRKGGASSAHVADAFERMLAELRSSGEGVIIAEQSPTKLIKGAVDLTNLKIVHRLASPEEGSAVGGTMTASEAQQSSFQRLAVGEAAIFTQGMEGLSFMRAPNYKNQASFDDRLPKGVVRSTMNSYYEKNPRLRNPFHGCALCRAQQQFRDDVSTVLVASPSRLLSIREKVGAGDLAAVREFQTIADLSGHSSEREAAWCAFTQAMDSFDEDYIFHVDDRQQFESDYQTLVETK